MPTHLQQAREAEVQFRVPAKLCPLGSSGGLYLPHCACTEWPRDCTSRKDTIEPALCIPVQSSSMRTVRGTFAAIDAAPLFVRHPGRAPSKERQPAIHANLSSRNHAAGLTSRPICRLPRASSRTHAKATSSHPPMDRPSRPHAFHMDRAPGLSAWHLRSGPHPQRGRKNPAPIPSGDRSRGRGASAKAHFRPSPFFRARAPLPPSIPVTKPASYAAARAVTACMGNKIL